MKKLSVALSIFIALLFCQQLKGQAKKGEFSYAVQPAVNFCQIDGDGDGGFRKFGYSLGVWIGRGMGKNWNSETGFAFSTRGSRRAFDPENPGNAQFNYHYSMIDIPFFMVKYAGSFHFGPGIRTTFLLSAEDKEGFYNDLKSDMRGTGLLGCVMLGYKWKQKSLFRLEYQYSLQSIRKGNTAGNLFFPTGVYHHVVSLGYCLQFSSANE
jgi:hypothetical protein